jgi:transcriptional regulator with XRE-family HTH domain
MAMAATTSASPTTATRTICGGDNGIGRIVRDLRKQQSFSQEDLALEACVSVATIKPVESDGNTSIKILAKIARALGCELKIDIREK